MKSIVIYFSRADENYMRDGIRKIDKGNTEIVAEKISKLTGASLFKVETVNPYPYNYYDCCDVAKRELNNNERPEIKNHLTNLDDYDTIYIGGPVWWGHYPCALFTALEGLNYEGKTIKPFCTHEGSGLGSIMEDVKQLTSNGNISKGLEIRGCDALNSDEKIEKWV